MCQDLCDTVIARVARDKWHTVHPQLRGHPPSPCSLWSLLAPLQRSSPSARSLASLCNKPKVGNRWLDNKHCRNWDRYTELSDCCIFSFFFFYEKIAYKEDSAKQQGMERTYSRVINRTSSSAPAATTPSNPDAWLRHGEHAALQRPVFLLSFCFVFLLV